MKPAIVGARRLPGPVADDDKNYAIDLGLLKREPGVLKAANPIYQEAILRALSPKYEEEGFGQLPSLAQPNRLVKEGRLDWDALLKEFQLCWRENSGDLDPIDGYPEATAHLVLGAFLQRIFNGGVESLRREIALGNRRLDLCARHKGVSYPVELKINVSFKKFYTIN
jgi:hypothetical protein